MLIVVPLVVSERNDAAVWLPVALGAMLLILSLITKYELSIAKVIPMSVHLMIDAASGILLAASPWLFGFAEDVWEPHVVVGVIEIVFAVFTDSKSYVPATYSPSDSSQATPA